MSSTETTAKAPKKRTKFPGTFYVANSMEIFERLAWYGIYSLVMLYLTDTKVHGGLG